METLGLIHRERSKDDERKVIVKLSENGILLQEKAADIPKNLSKGFIPNVLSFTEVNELKDMLTRIINHLS